MGVEAEPLNRTHRTFKSVFTPEIKAAVCSMVEAPTSFYLQVFPVTEEGMCSSTVESSPGTAHALKRRTKSVFSPSREALRSTCAEVLLCGPLQSETSRKQVRI